MVQKNKLNFPLIIKKADIIDGDNKELNHYILKVDNLEFLQDVFEKKKLQIELFN